MIPSTPSKTWALSRGVWLVSHSLRLQQWISLNSPPPLLQHRSISLLWTCGMSLFCKFDLRLSRFDRRSSLFEFDLVKFFFLWLIFDCLKLVFTCVIHRVVWHFFLGKWWIGDRWWHLFWFRGRGTTTLFPFNVFFFFFF